MREGDLEQYRLLPEDGDHDKVLFPQGIRKGIPFDDCINTEEKSEMPPLPKTIVDYNTSVKIYEHTKDVLDNESGIFLYFYGPAGIGKSLHALRLAHYLVDRKSTYPGHVFWINLRYADTSVTSSKLNKMSGGFVELIASTLLDNKEQWTNIDIQHSDPKDITVLELSKVLESIAKQTPNYHRPILFLDDCDALIPVTEIVDDQDDDDDSSSFKMKKRGTRILADKSFIDFTTRKLSAYVNIVVTCREEPVQLRARGNTITKKIEGITFAGHTRGFRLPDHPSVQLLIASAHNIKLGREVLKDSQKILKTVCATAESHGRKCNPLSIIRTANMMEPGLFEMDYGELNNWIEIAKRQMERMNTLPTLVVSLDNTSDESIGLFWKKLFGTRINVSNDHFFGTLKNQTDYPNWSEWITSLNSKETIKLLTLLTLRELDACDEVEDELEMGPIQIRLGDFDVLISSVGGVDKAPNQLDYLLDKPWFKGFLSRSDSVRMIQGVAGRSGEVANAETYTSVGSLRCRFDFYIDGNPDNKEEMEFVIHPGDFNLRISEKESANFGRFMLVVLTKDDGFHHVSINKVMDDIDDKLLIGFELEMKDCKTSRDPYKVVGVQPTISALLDKAQADGIIKAQSNQAYGASRNIRRIGIQKPMVIE